MNQKIVSPFNRKFWPQNWKTFFGDLKNEIVEDQILTGSAALAYYFLLAIFPALIFLLSLLPLLPIPQLDQQILSVLREAMPREAATLVSDTVGQILSENRQGLLSFGALFTLWAASSGMAATMEQLNNTYDVTEGRSYFKTRLIALLLTLSFGGLVIVSFSLILAGEWIHNWLSLQLGWDLALLNLLAVMKWTFVAGALILAFALTYYFGPDVKQDFRFITPGSLLGVACLVLASLGFKLYVENFSSYNATYGSLGAVIILMLWLNLLGLVVLVGSEVNALIEHESSEGKSKGEKAPHQQQGDQNMENLSSTGPSTETPSYNQALRDLGTRLQSLLASEFDLIRTEMRETRPQITRHLMQTTIFAVIAGLSVFPFLAFLVILLGDAMGGQYAWSSLIVSVVCAAVGGFFCLRALKELREKDLKMPHTQRSLKRIQETFSDKVSEMKNQSNVRAL